MIRNKASKTSYYYLILFIIITIGVTVSLSIYTSYKVRGFFVNNSKKLLENNIYLLKESVDQFYSQTMDNVSANFNVFRSNIYGNGEFSLDTTRTIKQSALNQITNIEKEVELNVMLYNGKPVLNNFDLVDSIVEKVNINGLTTTIFQVIDNGILRISTNVSKANGSRAIGTYIPSDSIVYRTVMSGNIYRGRAYVVNQWYWTFYEPIFVDGTVIGVLYMGIKESVLLKVLKETFSSVTIGDSGYPFLMDSEGDLIIHPFNEGDSLKDVATSDGQVLYDIMKKRVSGWVEYTYPKPTDMKHEYKKLTRFMTVDGLGWVVGAGVYEDEFYTDFAQYEIFYGVILIIIMLVAGSVVAINIFNTNRRLIDQSAKLKKYAIDAENANIAKSAFLANMSHEIRTPLNSIIGFSDLLRASDVTPKEKEYADTISKSANTLLSIINDILDISKIESGKIELLEEEFNLQEVMDNIIKMISVRAKQKNIRFYYFYDTDIPEFIAGDPVRLQQVLVNLLGNAIKFTESGGDVSFTVHLLYKETNYQMIKFNISDTGIGIPKDSLENIFEPFNQADSGIGRRYGGTGLGLTICSKLVGMMGSTIKVASIEGKGATFSFTLPLRKAESVMNNMLKEKPFADKTFCVVGEESKYDNIKKMVVSYLKGFGKVEYLREDNKQCDIVFCFSPEEVKEHFSNKNLTLNNVPVAFVGDDKGLSADTVGRLDYIIDNPVYLSKVYNAVVQACGIEGMYDNIFLDDSVFKGNVLVAEDNHTNQLLMKIVLEKYGVAVDFVNDGLEALEYCRNQRPDLILMDINMPVMDGITSFFEIKKFCAAEKVPMIPVVALTANALKGDREKYLEAGMTDYLSKPIDNAELLRVLAEHLVITNRVPEVMAHTRTSGKKQAYNKEKSLKNIGISEQDYDNIINQLFSSLSDDLDRLDEAIANSDKDKIYSIIHYLKGAVVNLQLTPIVDLLEKYNNMAKTGKLEGYDTDELRLAFEDIRKQI